VTKFKRQRKREGLAVWRHRKGEKRTRRCVGKEKKKRDAFSVSGKEKGENAWREEI
jgi:hypothetical protein